MRQISIQAALDTIELDLAVSVAAEIADAVERIEVGTLLLRRHGMSVIKTLRDAFPESTLIADCKIMDCGYAESSLALDAGANGVIVQGAAPRATIEAVCRAAEMYGAFVMVDGLGIDDIGQLIPQVKGLPISHVIVHTGKDEQELDGQPPLEQVHAAAAEVSLPPLAVAGGLSPNNVAPILLEPKVEILIVGRAIMSSRAPRQLVADLHAAFRGEGVGG